MTSTAADYVAEVLAQAGAKRIYGVVRRSRSRPIYRAARSIARGRRIGLGIFRPDRDDRLVDPCARDLFLGGIAWLGSHGGGFSDIRFEGATVSAQQFAAWVQAAKTQRHTLSETAYDALARPSEAVAPAIYGQVAPGLFDAISAGRTSADCSSHQEQ